MLLWSEGKDPITIGKSSQADYLTIVFNIMMEIGDFNISL